MDEKEKSLFDARTPMTVVLKREGVSVTLRFPSDTEWSRRMATIKTVIKRLHGGASETETENVEAADEALLKAVRTDEGLDLDEGLASVVIARINKAEADLPEQTAEGYRIPVRVAGALTVHELRAPTEKEKRKYRRSAYRFIDLRHGRQELKTSLPAICEFYDLLATKSEGYAPGSPVPAPHKLAAVSELMVAIDAEDEEADPENFI
jgi:hypothetical protein